MGKTRGLRDTYINNDYKNVLNSIKMTFDSKQTEKKENI